MTKFRFFVIQCFIIYTIFIECSFAEKIDSSKPIEYQISGVNKDIQENIVNRLNASTAKTSQELEKEVKLAIEPFGYFHSNIKVEKKKETVLISVKLGQALFISKSSIEIIGKGENDANLLEYINKKNKLTRGEIFNTNVYNSTQADLINIAHNAGYEKAAFIRHEIYVNLDKNEAQIYLTLDTGPIFYYGPITFLPSPYNPSFLYRFLRFNQGDKYSPKQIESLQNHLLNSKYFSSVIITPEIKEENPDQIIPIKIETQAVAAEQYNLGLGYGTNTGPRTSLGFDLYRMTDTGQHLSTLLNISTISTNMSSTYYIPGKYPVNDQYLIGAYLGNFKPEAGNAYTKKIFLGYKTKWNQKWSITNNINYLYERFSINDAPYNSTNLLYPSTNISFLSADNPINPEKGNRINLETATGLPYASESFLKSELSGKSIYPISDNNDFILRGDFGVIYAKDYEQDYPLSMRYFAGGYNSVRGYSYESLGPGKYLKVISTEIQQKIYGDFYLGLFLDQGNASNSLSEAMERGIGLNFVYRTSLGPISIDIAQANTQEGKPLSIEFNFGANL